MTSLFQPLTETRVEKIMTEEFREWHKERHGYDHGPSHSTQVEFLLCKIVEMQEELERLRDDVDSLRNKTLD